ncbi:hypothetical protein HELRODRAFT_188653 [Helobdella robusta]|uniref:Uncharacterized protein n=1 Tax=Helobdella robusta TaxID=6412 RepID=T1FQ82_HELRO|nr:hypothetical protein HELRODRAFT_188653 [Helobdella robusta]ESO02293.1 hypothetical protein HELRODRAFT_188653 [Helobdella robusta]
MANDRPKSLARRQSDSRRDKENESELKYAQIRASHVVGGDLYASERRHYNIKTKRFNYSTKIDKCNIFGRFDSKHQASMYIERQYINTGKHKNVTKMQKATTATTSWKKMMLAIKVLQLYINIRFFKNPCLKPFKEFLRARVLLKHSYVELWPRVAWHDYVEDLEANDEKSTIFFKKSLQENCLTVTSECYTTEQCCSDLACVDTNNDGISGKCLAKKRLRRCTESIQCGEMTTCSSVIGSNSKYCVPDKLETSYDFARDFKDKMYNSQPVYSRNYDTQAYGTLLLRKPGSKGTGMPCISTDDCQMTDNYSGDPLCCQKISQGKMGSKLKCHTIINVDDCKPWSN